VARRVQPRAWPQRHSDEPGKELATLDSFDAVVLDDIGYVKQSRDEMDVLFTFLAERYERKSVVITNLVSSEWNRIFKDPMTTAAAIDRLAPAHAPISTRRMGKPNCG
jgi:DNA replication protein DnaC